MDKIISLLEKIDQHIETLRDASVTRDEVGLKHVAGTDILSLDGHLQKTMLGLLRFGRATAGEVASRTRRSRALESLYLNQLTQMRLVGKERVGKTVYFSTSK